MPGEDVMKYSSRKFNFKETIVNLVEIGTRRKCSKKNHIKVKLIDGKGRIKLIGADKIRKGSIILAEKGDIIPGKGIVVDGTAWVDESPITGESAPVLKDISDENKAVIENTMVLSSWLRIEIT